ncbi:nitronate monooxygenase [Nocardia brasiliensis]|uniref:nitronate monooxygenase n=1 Tax=Nocardia brasiliensis TaxID=37326 RepID=UPI00190F3977|nr:nitronate monooxygenase [Nocardia brasiliensis]
MPAPLRRGGTGGAAHSGVTATSSPSTAARGAGAALLVQVTDHDEARRAADVGADLIVAQGSEVGGHGAGRSTMTMVPTVADLVHPTPVLAADGIADGRGLAAALTLGRPVR